MKISINKVSLAFVLIAIALLGISQFTRADDDHEREREGGSRSYSRRVMTPPLPLYQQECSACHIAYPAGMLPAASWQRVMGGLQKHYGTDASLEPAALTQISQWLAANAGTYKRVREEPRDNRITQSAWFVRKHHEVRDSDWTLPKVKSAANCAACHTNAEKGDFNEHDVRIPRR